MVQIHSPDNFQYLCLMDCLHSEIFVKFMIALQGFRDFGEQALNALAQFVF